MHYCIRPNDRYLRMGHLGCSDWTSTGSDATAEPVTGSVAYSFQPFDKLTSVHVNCNDDYLIASGYSHSVAMYDLETGKFVRNFTNIHSGHINISRFGNQSPYLFATSSFDKTVKTWDARVSLTSNNKPIYSCSSQQGHVMLCFSPDDSFLLTSAVKSEVSQYLTVDGRLHLRFNPPANTPASLDNYTRR